MQHANEIFYFFMALLLSGLVVVAKSFVPNQKFFQPEGYWLIAVMCLAASCTFFALASFFFIILVIPANTLFITSHVYLAVYIRSLRTPISDKLKKILPVVILFIGLIFALILVYGRFIDRVFYVLVITISILLWQLVEIRLLQKHKFLSPKFLVFIILIELGIGLARFILLYFEGMPANIYLYQEPFFSTVIRWSFFSFSILSYIAVIGFLIEKLGIENVRANNENNLIKLARANENTFKSEQQLRFVLDATGDGIWDWNIVTGEVKHNLRWIEMLGEDPNQRYFSVEDFKSRIHPDDLNLVLDKLAEIIKDNLIYTLQYRMVRLDGHQIWVQDKGTVVERSSQGEPLRMVGAIRDITEDIAAQEKIHELIYFDSLTKLPNRTFIHNQIQIAIEQSIRNKTFSGLMYLDLDNFKDINDVYGHRAGDILLGEFGNRIQEVIRSVDVIARIGGDEYLILFENIAPSYDSARIVLEDMVQRILYALSQPFNLTHEVNAIAHASIGVVIFGDSNIQLEQLLLSADLTMYEAKSDSHSRYKFYDEQLKSEFDRKNTMLIGLKDATKLDQFFIEYQPVVNRHQVRVAYEALTRWQHPELGTIMPDDFINFAEKHGQMNEVGVAILRAIFSSSNFFDSAINSKSILMINISAYQLMSTAFADRFISLSNQYQIPLNRVQLEITEGVFLKDMTNAISTIKTLKNRGVKFVLDDFGTGYSSLSYLQKLPIEFLKLDKSFVSGMIANRDDQSIVDNILSLAKTLGLEVVAEGVETEEQFNLLYAKGCDYFQGWYFGRPSRNIESC